VCLESRRRWEQELAGMKAALEIRLPGQPNAVADLRTSYSIGRGKGNDLVIRHELVSRSHAIIRLLGNETYYIADLGSTNGTFLNGKLVLVPTAMNSGDLIQVGGCDVKFLQSPARRPEALVRTLGERSTAVAFDKEMVSVLVSDVRDYTRLSGAMSPTKLSQFMGGWFRDASEIIENNGGQIDKFIGDATMAFWVRAQADKRQEWAKGSVIAALELVRRSGEFNRQLVEHQPRLRFAIGCGVHIGWASLGNMGRSARRDFTATGSTVVTAFRLESLTRQLDRPILISFQTANELDGVFQFEDLGCHVVKGRRRAIHAYALVSD